MTLETHKTDFLIGAKLLLAVAIVTQLYSRPALAAAAGTQTPSMTPQRPTLAQKIVTEAAAKHRELSNLELSAIPKGKEVCETIASLEPKDIGEKCDEDEFSTMKTNMPVVEKESDEWDVTMSLHDSSGRLIGALGMDFKIKSGLNRTAITHLAKEIAKEIERQVPSSAALFAPEN